MKYILKTKNAGQVMIAGRVIKIVGKNSRKFIRWEYEIQTKKRSGEGDFFQCEGDVESHEFDNRYERVEVFEYMRGRFAEIKQEIRDRKLERSKFQREYEKEVMKNLGLNK